MRCHACSIDRISLTNPTPPHRFYSTLDHVQVPPPVLCNIIFISDFEFRIFCCSDWTLQPRPRKVCRRTAPCSSGPALRTRCWRVSPLKACRSRLSKTHVMSKSPASRLVLLQLCVFASLFCAYYGRISFQSPVASILTPHSSSQAIKRQPCSDSSAGVNSGSSSAKPASCSSLAASRAPAAVMRDENELRSLHSSSRALACLTNFLFVTLLSGTSSISPAVMEATCELIGFKTLSSAAKQVAVTFERRVRETVSVFEVEQISFHDRSFAAACVYDAHATHCYALLCPLPFPHNFFVTTRAGTWPLAGKSFQFAKKTSSPPPGANCPNSTGLPAFPPLNRTVTLQRRSACNLMREICQGQFRRVHRADRVANRCSCDMRGSLWSSLPFLLCHVRFVKFDVIGMRFDM